MDSSITWLPINVIERIIKEVLAGLNPREEGRRTSANLRGACRLLRDAFDGSNESLDLRSKQQQDFPTACGPPFAPSMLLARSVNLSSISIHGPLPGGEASSMAVFNLIAGLALLNRLKFEGTCLGHRACAALGNVLSRDRPTCLSLELGRHSVGEHEANILFLSIGDSPCLRRLDVLESAIDISAWRTLGAALQINTSIRQLCINSASFRNTGALALAAALAVNTNLEHLDLSECWISQSGIAAIGSALSRSRGLRSLSLAKNLASYEGGAQLAEALKSSFNLTSLDMSGCALSGGDGYELCKALGANTRIKTLRLRDNRIAPSNLRDALEENRSLTHLDIGRNRVSPTVRCFITQ